MAVKEAPVANISEERSKGALKLAIEKLKKKTFGKGSIMKLGDKTTVNVDAIPTGALIIRCCSWYRRYSARTYYRNLRS